MYNEVHPIDDYAYESPVNDSKLERLYEHLIKLSSTETFDEIVSVSLSLISSVFGYKYGSIGIIVDDMLVFQPTEQRRGLELPMSGKGITLRAIKT